MKSQDEKSLGAILSRPGIEGAGARGLAHAGVRDYCNPSGIMQVSPPGDPRAGVLVWGARQPSRGPGKWRVSFEIWRG